MVETQWNVGFAGPVGLDYSSIKVVAESIDYPFDDLTIKLLRTVERKVLEKAYSK